MVVAPIHWDIMEEFQWAQQTDPPLTSCPPTKQYIQHILQQSVIQWVHTSLSTGHPGIQQTIALVPKLFWWSDLTEDVTSYSMSSLVLYVLSQKPQRNYLLDSWNPYPFLRGPGPIYQ